MSQKKKNDSKGILKRILHFTRPHLFYLVIAAVFSVINVALTLYIPILIGSAIDCAIEAGRVDFEAMLPPLSARRQAG